jgi:hypothetical protein
MDGSNRTVHVSPVSYGQGQSLCVPKTSSFLITALRLTVDRGWARLAQEIGSQQARDNRRKFRKAASANNTLRFWQLKG